MRQYASAHKWPTIKVTTTSLSSITEECYSGNNASATYAKHGESKNCQGIDKTLGFGVGKQNANFVYRIN